MRRGPKGLSPDQKAARGETRPSRTVTVLFPDHASRPDPDEIAAPKGMTPAARKIWAVKVDRYRQRGQKIQGFEDALRQYCELEAALNAGFKSRTVTMAMVNAHRLWAAEFYDTPASHKAPASSAGRQNNPFSRNGQQRA